ncbi:MAG: STAS domain-containing protein [Proteobacteria bacterium]|nr:STAS domain-containing protein [Pseudomonadota bacterium]
MSEDYSNSGAGMNVVHRNLVVTLNAEPDEASLRLLQKEMLEKIETAPVKGVLIDVSSVKIIDAALFGLLAGISKMVRLLGPKVIFTGFGAGLASALVDLDVDLDSIDTAVTLNDAMELINPVRFEEDLEQDIEESDSE